MSDKERIAELEQQLELARAWNENLNEQLAELVAEIDKLRVAACRDELVIEQLEASNEQYQKTVEDITLENIELRKQIAEHEPAVDRKDGDE